MEGSCQQRHTTMKSVETCFKLKTKHLVYMLHYSETSVFCHRYEVNARLTLYPFCYYCGWSADIFQGLGDLKGKDLNGRNKLETSNFCNLKNSTYKIEFKVFNLADISNLWWHSQVWSFQHLRQSGTWRKNWTLQIRKRAENWVWQTWSRN